LITEPFGTDGGFVYPPTQKPGLGIEVIDAVVDRYRERPAR
jgi:L-alanine-DL-glutamate epimerase-like enolase superfamily enzyme